MSLRSTESLMETMSYCLSAQNLRTGAPPAKSFGIMPPSRYLSNNDLVNKDTSTSRSSGIVYREACLMFE